jgi:transposase
MTDIRKLVQEEVRRLVTEAKEKAPTIEKKLQELKKKLKPDQKINSFDHSRKAKALEIKTVSDLLDVEINELVLYFLNNVKTDNNPVDIEYNTGRVLFYFSE